MPDQEESKIVQQIKLEMAQKRKELNKLKEALKEGKGTRADIDACKGYLDVLKKELRSVEDSGHTTFLASKKVISPKFKVGSKKQETLKRLKETNEAIGLYQAKLTDGRLEPMDREKLEIKIETLVQAREEAKIELKALKEYNHTRFLNMKEHTKENLTEEERIRSNEREKTIKQSLREARVLVTGDSGNRSENLKEEPLEEKGSQNEVPQIEGINSSLTVRKQVPDADDLEPPPMIWIQAGLVYLRSFGQGRKISLDSANRRRRFKDFFRLPIL